jgi:gliding motility-associated-like protein
MKNKKIFLFILISIFSISIFSQENTSITCGDGIDNDGDGLIDCEDNDCQILPNDGCLICSDGISFADTVLEYSSGCPFSDPEVESTLGVSDYDGVNIGSPSFAFLGEGGFIKLGFTNNNITNSGNADADLRIFEIGPAVEPAKVALRPVNPFTISQLTLNGFSDIDADGFFEIGSIGGSTSSIDLDLIMPGNGVHELNFDAIQLTDILDGNCNGITPGADIDAVCALSFVEVDCEGTINGSAILDQCGECLQPTDPNFNQSCTDCEGTLNGLAMIDQCGECLQPNDPNFNQSCADCEGTINGSAILNECGICLQPNDPNFSLVCSQLYNIYIPTAFSPNDDGRNDRFEVYSAFDNDILINKYMIFDRWGELLFRSSNFDINSSTNWWDGSFNGKKLNSGIFIYLIYAEFKNGEIKQYSGDITLTR